LHDYQLADIQKQLGYPDQRYQGSSCHPENQEPEYQSRYQKPKHQLGYQHPSCQTITDKDEKDAKIIPGQRKTPVQLKTAKEHQAGENQR